MQMVFEVFVVGSLPQRAPIRHGAHEGNLCDFCALVTSWPKLINRFECK